MVNEAPTSHAAPEDSSPEADTRATAIPTVARQLHLLRWFSALAVGVVAIALGREFATTPNIDWSVAGEYIFDARILQGLRNTLLLTVSAMALAVALGILLAAMRLSDNPVARAISFGYVWAMRSVPTLLQIILWFNLALVFDRITIGIPGTGLELASWSTNDVITPYVAALLGLGLSEAAYYSEIVRGALLGVDPGQKDASKALGMTSITSFRVVVFPQAMKMLIPPTGNELIGLLKYTSLASVIAYNELLGTATIIYSANLKTIELLLTVSFWFFVCTTVLNIGQYFVERRFGRGGRAITSGRSFGQIWRSTWTMRRGATA